MRQRVLSLIIASTLAGAASYDRRRRRQRRSRLIDVLARQVGILGVFSDWAAPVTYYANCMGMK